MEKKDKEVLACYYRMALLSIFNAASHYLHAATNPDDLIFVQHERHNANKLKKIIDGFLERRNTYYKKNDPKDYEVEKTFLDQKMMIVAEFVEQGLLTQPMPEEQLNGSRLCEGKGLEALNFKISTNDR